MPLPPSSLLLLLLVVLAASVGSVPVPNADFCPDECDPERCPRGAKVCPLGLVADPCGCCPQGLCGRAEGEECFHHKAPPREPGQLLAQCAEGLVCSLRHDLSHRDEPQALCACEDTREACGSDNRTYDSICQLKAEALRYNQKPALLLQHWGPCVSVPWIVSGPEDTNSGVHTSISLDCEAKGYPIPSVHWEFRSLNGTVRVLPSDDLHVAVQVRGGPESYMETSWVQIVDLRHSDAGTYACIATNSEGMTSASAKLVVHG